MVKTPLKKRKIKYFFDKKHNHEIISELFVTISEALFIDYS